jgi:predicted signal transduction protein with EAL and GGDEF domain
MTSGRDTRHLSYLTEFPVDVVKIDQSFIVKLTNSRASHAIVSKTIELAHLLDLTVVCEGVETAVTPERSWCVTKDRYRGPIDRRSPCAANGTRCTWSTTTFLGEQQDTI